jgi:peptidoglycan/xylan/chitin deacetylase (PgdA/CDA1 family)
MTEPLARDQGRPGVRSSLANALGAVFLTGVGRALWPEAVAERLSILIYHRILAQPDPLLPNEITVDQFRDNMKMLANRFNVLDLSEGLRRLEDGTLPPLSVCITFDDGYRDNCTEALPVLKQFGLPATFFVATGYLDGGRMWNDTLLGIIHNWQKDAIDLRDWGIPLIAMTTAAERQKAWKALFRWMRRIGIRGRDEMLARLQAVVERPLPDDLMMTTEHVRMLHAEGMGIGCHTDTHPILTRVTDAIVREEITRSRSYLEDSIQAPVRYFAYPNGVPEDDYSRQHVEIVKELGFEAAFSTAWGAARPSSDMFQLPRFTPWDRSSPEFALRLILSRRAEGYPQAA